MHWSICFGYRHFSNLEEDNEMTKERFTQILIEEGMDPMLVEEVWDSRPEGVELEEARVRFVAQWTLADFPQFRRQTNDSKQEKTDQAKPKTKKRSDS
jgi:hypothetical protein